MAVLVVVLGLLAVEDQGLPDKVMMVLDMGAVVQEKSVRLMGLMTVVTGYPIQLQERLYSMQVVVQEQKQQHP